MLPKAVGEHSLLERNVSDAVLITVKTLIVVPVVSIPAIKCDFALGGVIYNIINVSFDDVVFKDASVKRSVKVKGYGIKFNSIVFESIYRPWNVGRSINVKAPCVIENIVVFHQNVAGFLHAYSDTTGSGCVS